MTKGHVPEQNLPRYRQLKQLFWDSYELKQRLIEAGQRDLALQLFPLMGALKQRAHELRVDLPDPCGGNVRGGEGCRCDPPF